MAGRFAGPAFFAGADVTRRRRSRAREGATQLAANAMAWVAQGRCKYLIYRTDQRRC